MVKARKKAGFFEKLSTLTKTASHGNRKEIETFDERLKTLLCPPKVAYCEEYKALSGGSLA